MKYSKNSLEENYTSNWSMDSLRLYPITGEQEKSYLMYSQELGYFKTTPGYYTKRKHLASFLILSTVSGKGILKYRGQEYLLEEGSSFFIHCYESHEYYSIGDTPWEFFWIHFEGSQAGGYFQQFTEHGFALYSASETDFNIPNQIDSVIRLYQGNSPGTPILVNKILTDVISEFLLRSVQSDPSDDAYQVPELILQVKRYLEKNFSDSPGLEELSHIHGISKFHLSREFKKYVGITIHQYLTRQKLAYSKELLNYSNFSIEEIGYQCGFHYSSHFIRQFQLQEGLTPFAYRQKWKNRKTDV
ncbi:MAG: helix-turn-helix domain-containing protein [Lachnospiraceae bacterium]